MNSFGTRHVFLHSIFNTKLKNPAPEGLIKGDVIDGLRTSRRLTGFIKRADLEVCELVAAAGKMYTGYPGNGCASADDRAPLMPAHEATRLHEGSRKKRLLTLFKGKYHGSKGVIPSSETQTYHDGDLTGKHRQHNPTLMEPSTESLTESSPNAPAVPTGLPLVHTICDAEDDSLGGT